MIARKLLPSAIDPEVIGDLIDDCQSLAGTAFSRVIDLSQGIPVHRIVRAPVVITDRIVSLLDGYGEYGG